MVGNKKDAPGAQERASIVREVYGNAFPMTTISAATASAVEVEEFKRVVYDFLDVVRVYTKAPGKKPDFADPYVVARGSTVLDVAEKVHDCIGRMLARLVVDGAALAKANVNGSGTVDVLKDNH